MGSPSAGDVLGQLIGARDESKGLDEGGDTGLGQACCWYVVKGGEVRTTN